MHRWSLSVARYELRDFQIVAQLAGHGAPTLVRTRLLALSIGAGSLFFSHINDAGFWLVKEYMGMSLPNMFKTWSVLETIIAVMGLVLCLALSLVV